MFFGIGGVKVMEVLGIDINKYYLNESYAVFAVFELKDFINGSDIFDKIVFIIYIFVKYGYRGYIVNIYY